MAALEMRKTGPKVSLNDNSINLDKLIEDNADKVVEIPLDELVEFKYKGAIQPFGIREDEVAVLVDSFNSYGQLTPCAVRPYKNKYQMISGHKRLRAAKKLGLEHLKCIIFECDDKTAFELVKHYNIQRDKPLPSEIMQLVMQTKKANANNKTDDSETSSDAKEELTVTEIAKLFGVERKHIYRCYALRKLPKAIQNAVDQKIIGTNDIEKIVNNIPEQHLSEFSEWVEYQDKKVSASTLRKVFEWSEHCSNTEDEFSVDSINYYLDKYDELHPAKPVSDDILNNDSTSDLNYFDVLRFKYARLADKQDSDLSSLIDELLTDYFSKQL